MRPKRRIAALERALAEAKRPVQITQVTDSRSRGISSLDRYSSSVIHPTWYSGRSSSFRLLPTGKDGDQEAIKPHLLSSGDPDSEISGEFSADYSFVTCGSPDSGYQSSGQGRRPP